MAVNKLLPLHALRKKNLVLRNNGAFSRSSQFLWRYNKIDNALLHIARQTHQKQEAPENNSGAFRYIGTWQEREDSNPRPLVLETSALARLSYAPIWYPWRDSNPRRAT